MLTSLAQERRLTRWRIYLFVEHRFVLVIWIPLLGILAGAPSTGQAETSPKLLEKGIEQYNYGLFEESLTTLDRAARGNKDPHQLGQIHLYRAINYAVLDKGALARQAFNKALAHDPRLVLDTERFKESIINIFQSVKRERKKYGPKTSPPAAPAPVSPSTSQPSSQPAAAGPVASGSFVIRPGTRPWVVSLALGGALGLDSSPSQFKLRQTFDYHFSGASSGIGLGLLLGESLGGDGAILQVGPRLFWDIQLSSRAGFYLSPALGLGLTYIANSPEGRHGSNEDILAVTAALGVELKLILADRVLLFLRPLGLELMIGGEGLDTVDGLLLRYDLLLGVGVTL